MAGSYGAGNYAMWSEFIARFYFAWPNSHVVVMGAAQAGKVLRIVAEGKQKASGQEPNPQMLDFLEQSTAMKLEQQSTALSIRPCYMTTALLTREIPENYLFSF